MKKQQLIKVLYAFIIIVAVIFNVLYVSADGEKQNESKDTNTDLSNNSSKSVIGSDYFAYYNSHIEDFAATDQIILDQNSVLCPENNAAQYKTADTESGLVMDSSCPWYEWKVSVPQDSRYAIYVHYYPLEDTDKDILFPVWLTESIRIVNLRVFRFLAYGRTKREKVLRSISRAMICVLNK